MSRNEKTIFDAGYAAGQKWTKDGANVRQLERLSKRWPRGPLLDNQAEPLFVYGLIAGPEWTRPRLLKDGQPRPDRVGEAKQFWENLVGSDWEKYWEATPFWKGFVAAAEEAYAAECEKDHKASDLVRAYGQHSYAH